MKVLKDPLNSIPLVLYIVTNLLITSANTERVFPGNPYSHREVLDPDGKFILEWIADPKNPDIVFNITAETRGYVAIGFSKTGKMLKSDIVIGGVRRNKRTYLSDRFTTAKDRYPKQDLEQNWKLIDSWENRTHTSIKIMRQRETCDPHDFPIEEGSIHLLWAYGEDDVLDYHFKNRGSIQTHLLQPDLTPDVLGSSPSPQQMIAVPSMPSSSSTKAPPPTNETRLDVWRLTVTVENPPSGEPWCVFQQGPELRKKHYIIGFSTAASEEKMRNQLDRLVVYKCSPTERGKPNSQANGQDGEESAQKFDRFEDYSGECKNATDLYMYCNRIIYTWGRGGKDTFLPKTLGVPFGVKDEYYLLESFFIPPNYNEATNMSSSNSSQSTNDTSESSRSREFDIDIDLLLTQTPRKNEAKILKIGYDPMSTLLIPPGSMDFETFGHCPNECTSQMIPKRRPMKIFGVSFDTGQNGKSVGLHHFRNAFEIPLIMENKNHDPSFQQMQLLRQQTVVRPGDQLTVRCKFGTRVPSDDKPLRPSKNTPIPSPRCLAYLWYYQENTNNTNSSSTAISDMQSDQYECTSKIHPSDLYRWVEENAPQSFKRFPKLNTDFSQLLQSKLDKLRWTPFLRLSMFELYEFGRYRASCGFPSLTSKQQSNRTRTNITNRNRTTSAFQNYRNRSNNGTRTNSNTSRNGTNRGPASQASTARSTSSASSEITVHPLPVEDLPYALECPTLDDDGIAAGASGPLLFAPLPPGPVIFGFP